MLNGPERGHEAEKAYQSQRLAAAGYTEAQTESFTGGVEAATNSMDAATVLACRVQELVGRLCGPVPVPVSNQKDVAPSSVMDQLRRRAALSYEQISLAHDALSRLEREI